MFSLKKHIALVSLLVFFTPTVIHLHHIFEAHEHFVCVSKDKQHTHKQSETKCELCDFTMLGFIIPEFINALEIKIFSNNDFLNSYCFLSDYQKLYFSLRAPPLV